MKLVQIYLFFKNKVTITIRFLGLFCFFFFNFSFLDPDPYSEYGSGSTTLLNMDPIGTDPVRFRI